MEVLTAIAAKFLELTVEPIGRQLGYVIFYDRNVKGLKDEFQELRDERQVVQHLVDAARRQGEDIEEKVENWFKKVDEMIEHAKKLYGEESHANTRCSYKSCPNLWLRHQISRKAKKMTQEIVEMKEKGKFDRVSFYVPPQTLGLPSTSSSTMNEGMDSRNSTLDEILKALADPNVNMVGLCGLAGVGKTTLAKDVARKARELNLFDKVVMVIVAQNPNLKEIQTQIAENVGMKLDVESLNARASHLEERLKKEKNLLMVLDDLWEQLDLDQVGIPFDYDGKKKDHFGKKKDPLVNEDGGNCNCCKILLTSRNEELLSIKMNCKKNIKVGVLSKEEAWKLFKGKAKLHDNSVHLDLAAEVAQQCGGLPLAIVTVAGALRNKKSNEWRDALQRLKRPLRRNFSGIKEVDSSLKLSYDHLESDGLQSIFLLSAMLSHDPLIVDLLMYSVGLSLLHDVLSMKDAQNAIDVLVSKLKALSLFLDSSSNDHFTIHDVVREFAHSILSKEQHALVVRHEKQYDLPSKTLLEAYTRMSLDKCGICELPEEFYCPRLEFFLLDSLESNLRIPSTFFKSMKELKVMGFTNMHFSSLPSSLGILEKLSTLCLHSCILEDIAEVGNLKYLKVLSLAYSDVKKLPCELAQLTCLQMLNLAHCAKLKYIPPNVLSSLKRLEILYMENSFNKWQAESSSEGNQNASLGELRHLQKLSSLEVHIPDASVLPNDLFLENSLERYKIFIGEDWEWGGEYETLKTLKLKLNSGIQSEYGIQKLLEGVEDLYLDELNGITNVVYDLDERGFPKLKHLRIQNNGQIEYVVNNTKRPICVFPNLETLNLHNLDGLKKLCQGQITAAFFQNLKVLKVESCNELKSVFSISMTGLFRHLEEIVINGCKSMKEIVASTTQDSSDEQKSAANIIIFSQLCFLDICHLPALTTFYFEENAADRESDKISKSLHKNKVSFPKLERLKLASINNLIISVWDDKLPQNSFRNLKSLIVENCGFVKLVPLHVLKSLSNLEKLEVSDCELLETVFDLEELNSYKETQLLLVVPLKELKLWYLPKLKNVWSNDSKGMVSFHNLQKLNAFFCESLTSVFPASVAKSMGYLEELKIWDCGIDVVVAKDESGAIPSLFPRLTTLNLDSLPNLRNFYPQRHMSKWPLFQELHIANCDELEIFENEVSSSSIIQKQEIPDSEYALFFHEKVIPNLEKLNLGGKCAEMIWNDQSPFYFCKVKKLSISLDAPSNNIATFLYGLHKRFKNLEQLQLEAMGGEILFPCMEPLGDVVAPFTQLLLFSLFDVKHIWNEYSQPNILQNLESLDVKWCGNLINLGPSFISLGNLTEIKVDHCNSMINFLTSHTARSLVQLKRLEIKDCKRIEEIITKQKDDVEKEIVFKKLEYLRLDELRGLKRFCSHSYNFMFPLLGQAVIRKCPKLSLFCSGDTQTPLLKGVKVTEGDMAWETNLNRTIQLWHLQLIEYLKLDEHPDMKNIWDGKLPQHLSFSRLKSLVVDNCDFLFEYVIPSHLVRFLSNLKELKVSNCLSVTTIFDMKGMHVDEDLTHSLEAICLEKLKLDHLPNLKYVWSKDHDGTNSFQCLQELYVRECDSLRYIFVACTGKGLNQLKENGVETLQPLFLVEKVSFSKLKRLELNSINGLIISIWDDKLPQNSFRNLKSLIVESCHFVKLIPLHVLKSLSNLEELKVCRCKLLEVVFDLEELNSYKETRSLQVVPMKKLRLQYLPKLKNVWSNDIEGMVTFHNLQKVEVDKCESLTSVFPASVAKGMRYLEKLEIKNCGIDVIVAKDESGATTSLFPSLTSLSLWYLPNLRNFYPQRHTSEWPFLQKLSIGHCNKLEIFENKVSSSSIIQGQERGDSKYPLFFHEKIEYLKVDEYPDTENIWDGKSPHHLSFRRLKSLVVDNCDFLFEYVIPSHLVRFLSNLKELEVSNCPSVKTIFDLKGINADEYLTHSLEAICLEKLKLDHLPNLKYVWTKDHDGTNSFQCLQELCVRECDSLRYIFVASTAKGLTQLKRLIIESCGVVVIITEDDTLKSEASPCFVFPQLSYLSLQKLPNLKSLYPSRYTCEWPRLRELFMYLCENLQVFGSQMTRIAELFKENGVETQQPLFLVEKVIPKLKGLLLTQKDASMIKNGQFQVDLFHELKTLHLASFADESAISAYGFLKRFPNLHELRVLHSSFEDIIPSQPQIINCMGKTASFKKLYLGYLDQLKNIWNDDSQLRPAHQNLKHLEVECCPSLMKLIPSSTSFENLTYLKVSKCHQLIYLATISTAKSLVNLYRLEIMDCKRMEEVVTNESEDAEAGTIFNDLRWLTLTGLPSLKTFCPRVLKTSTIWLVKLEEDEIYKVKDINKRIEFLFLAKDGKNVQES